MIDQAVHKDDATKPDRMIGLIVHGGKDFWRNLFMARYLRIRASEGKDFWRNPFMARYLRTRASEGKA